MYKKKHPVKRYAAIVMFIVVLVIQCIGVNANVIISNAESKNVSTTDDESFINKGEEENNEIEQNNEGLTNDSRDIINKEDESSEKSDNVQDTMNDTK